MTLTTVALSPAYEPHMWHTFFTLSGTAAATLTGLFFIAFSLRLQDLQLSLVIRTRARYLLIGLIVITVGSGFVLMPDLSLTALGAECLGLSVAYAVYTVWSILRAARQEPLPLTADLVGRWIGMAATLLLSSGAGISLIVRQGGGLYLLAYSLLLGLALEVASAWSLIVGIGRDTRRKDIPPRTYV